MSRGPGRCQRQVLAATAEGWAYLVDLLPEGCPRAQYVALHRAATTLADAGKIEYLHYTYGSPKVAVGPLGAPRPDRTRDLDHLDPEPCDPDLARLAYVSGCIDAATLDALLQGRDLLSSGSTLTPSGPSAQQTAGSTLTPRPALPLGTRRGVTPATTPPPS